MSGLKEAVLIVLLLVCVAQGAKRNAQCDQVCQRKMTIECCECIGCHQGMRFGKRSAAFSTPELEEQAISRNNELSGLEQAIAEIELELLANRIARGKLAQFNH